MLPPRRILLVEPDPLIQGWISRVLRDEGFEVSVADTVKRGSRYLSNATSFAAVVCNQHLPDGTWLDLLGEFRGFPLLMLRRPNNPPPPSWQGMGFEVLTQPFNSAQLLAKLAILVPGTKSGDTSFLHHRRPNG